MRPVVLLQKNGARRAVAHAAAGSGNAALLGGRPELRWDVTMLKLHVPNVYVVDVKVCIYICIHMRVKNM